MSVQRLNYDSTSESQDISDMENNILSTTIQGITISDANVAEVIRSNERGYKIIHKGHMYTIHRKTFQNITWQCMKRFTSECQATLTTSTDFKNPVLKIEHSHGPDYAAAQAARERQMEQNTPLAFENFENGSSRESPEFPQVPVIKLPTLQPVDKVDGK